jgi:hypothetical protein
MGVVLSSNTWSPIVFRSLLSVLLLSMLCTQLCAEDEFPKQLIGFLKSGQHVGLSTRPDEPTFVLVFKNQTDMAVHKDAEKLSVEELRKKYPQVERQASDLLKKVSHDSVVESKLPKLEIGRYAPLRYARILHVGEDYVLLEFENAYRTAYSSTQIGRIAWANGETNLYLTGIDKEDRTKP